MHALGAQRITQDMARRAKSEEQEADRQRLLTAFKIWIDEIRADAPERFNSYNAIAVAAGLNGSTITRAYVAGRAYSSGKTLTDQEAKKHRKVSAPKLLTIRAIAGITKVSPPAALLDIDISHKPASNDGSVTVSADPRREDDTVPDKLTATEDATLDHLANSSHDHVKFFLRELDRRRERRASTRSVSNP